MKNLCAWLAIGAVIGATASGCASRPTNPSGQSINGILSGDLSDLTVGERYQVKSGDTVSQIASHYKVDWRLLSKFNNLDDKHTIYAGQWLNIPILASTNTSSTNLTSTVTTTIKSLPESATLAPNPAPNNTAPMPPILAASLVAPRVSAPMPPPMPIVVAPAEQPSAPVAIPVALNAIDAPPPPLTTAPPPMPSPQKTESDGQFIYPVAQGNAIARGFGAPLQSGTTLGMFFVGEAGDAIFVSEAGTVVYANAAPTAQNRPMVLVEHSKGYTSTYFDVGQIAVKAGDTIKKGQRLGVMTPQTKSGKALFEFRIAQNGRYIDPLLLIKR